MNGHFYQKGDIGEFAWEEIDIFSNSELIFEIVRKRHNLSAKHLDNARKQAEQIKYFIRLAQELRRAAEIGSRHTRALQAYYTAMNLATAEILVKNTGDFSFDRNRDIYQHHGLDFKFSAARKASMQELAAGIVARPRTTAKKGFPGTFVAWQKNASHRPLPGFERTISGKNDSSGPSLIFGKGLIPDQVKTASISLLECFENTPSLHRSYPFHNLENRFVRCEFGKTNLLDQKENLIGICAHPDKAEKISKLKAGINFKESSVSQKWLDERDTSFIGFYLFPLESSSVTMDIPEGIAENCKDVFLSTDVMKLNEFGYLYVGLFLLSNLVRYYPDVWGAHIEKNSDFIVACARFVEHALQRLPVLAYSEILDNPLYFYDSSENYTIHIDQFTFQRLRERMKSKNGTVEA